MPTPPLPLLLGSASPRRRRLLRELRLPFETATPDVREVLRVARPRWTARENAQRKQAWCREHYPGFRALTADTVVAFAGCCLTKPVDRKQAAEFLERLSGATHSVYTAIALGAGWSSACRREVVESRVTFRRLSRADIRRYLDLVDPLDKAGGYDIDDHGDLLITSVDGSRSNVAGLPLERLRAWLKR